MLKIITKRGMLELASELSMQIDETSPVMNDRGSQSLPLTVPATPANAMIFNFPFRLDAAADVLGGDFSCTVADGASCRRGMINMVSASRRDGITFNVGFDNSEAYAKWRNKRLADLTSLPVVKFSSINDFAQYMEGVRLGTTDADFAVFPIIVENGDNVVCLNNEPFKTAKWTRTQQINGAETAVTLPAGYGVTGFIYVWRALELIFEDFKMTIEENPFWMEPELRRLVILNNCADSCCAGSLRYSDFMPSCTVDELLEALRVRFGLVYNVDFNRNKASLRLVKDIVADSVCDDLTEYIAEPPEISFPAPKYISLSAATSLDGAAPSTERFEDFIKDADTSHVTSATEKELSMQSPLIYITVTGEWYKFDSLNEEYVSSGTSFFNWDPQTEGLEAEAMSSSDEFVPIIAIDNDGAPSGKRFLPAYCAGTAHHHSYIKGFKADAEETPLAFLFAFSGVVNAPEYMPPCFGSWTPAMPNGENVCFADGSSHSLTLLFQFASGLFARFWRRYDEILRHGFRTVEASLTLPRHYLGALDTLRPVVICGQRMLIDSFSYELPGNAVVKVDMKLRTLRTVGDYVLSLEQNIPDWGPGMGTMKWMFLESTMRQAAEEACAYALDEYNEAHGTDYNMCELVEGSITTSGYKTWQNDELLMDLVPDYDGAVIWWPEIYYCKATYRIGIRWGDEHDGGDSRWEATHTYGDIEYSVKLMGRIDT